MTVPPPGAGNPPGHGYGPAGEPDYGGYYAQPGPTNAAPYNPTPHSAAPVCSWHPERQTNLSCTRCGRPACPQCLTPATVGFHCRQCVAESRSTQRVARTHAGSRVDEKPIVSYLLIGVNVLVFLITAVQSRSVMEMDGWVFDQGTLVPWSAGNGDWWQLITSGFLHIGIIHLGVNMLSLYMIGPTLERFVGRIRFLVIYLVSLLGGSVAVMLWGGLLGGVAGASGALFGLLGALGATFTRYKFDLRQLAIVLALNLWISFQFAGISWQGHVGGLVTGAIMGAIMVYAPAKKRVAWQVALTLAVLAVLIGVLVLRSGQIPECVVAGGYRYCS
jgi:membrane associated rhomboid family serine protease